ncbi:hypothetical protein GQ600_9952 [Phytophthora cactorum]|nr:hypothetical protein GQ600_9952 [Phytophthora cactorum]
MGQQATKQGISRIAVLQINGKGGHLHKYKDVAGNEAHFEAMVVYAVQSASILRISVLKTYVIPLLTTDDST